MNNNFFESQFFVNNRRRLRQSLASDAPLVITANGSLQRGGDSAFPFQQDANFWYLTGLNEPDFILYMNKETEYLFLPERSTVLDIFEGTMDEQELRTISGIASILPAKEGWKQLAGQLNSYGQVWTLTAAPAYIKIIGMYTNPARAKLVQKMKRLKPGLVVNNLSETLAAMRVIKQGPEITAIKQAVDITCQSFKFVQAKSYQYEYQLEADLSQQFRNRGAAGHAYDPIVAAAGNACTLHYAKNQAAINNDDLVLVDAGAQYSQYAADITRTWCIDKPNARQRDVIDAVNETLEFGLSNLRPGPSFYECEQKVRKYTGKKLKELGLISKATDKQAIRRYYPHSPHYLGLNVHDVGDYRQPLKAGMVLTLEPGIYIPEEGIGVRIEDDILITEKGCEVLSASLPRVLD